MVNFYLFNSMIQAVYNEGEYLASVLASAISVIVYAFSLLFFFKAYDKYRNEPFFLNKKNNLRARINIFFLISIFSLIATPLFIFVTPENYTFDLLPLISFIILYNIVWLYYFYQPTDFFHVTEREFKHIHKFKKSVAQLHNLICRSSFYH